MAVAPHALAAQSAIAVLRDGGNAVEAMVAAAATIAVAYPHMNGLGGDGFWLVDAPGHGTRALDACGRSAAAASLEHYRDRGLSTAIPSRGPLAACTVAGTVSGWDAALAFSRQALGGRLPLERLLADAIDLAANGTPVTASQARATATRRAELEPQPGFAATFLPAGDVPGVGTRFRQPRLAATLQRLAEAGLDDFYRGDLARGIATDLAALGSPLSLDDLGAHRAEWRTPLSLAHRRGTVFNMTPPTQGVVSLAILGLLDRAGLAGLDPEGADWVHRSVEATKLAFGLRDRHVTDPAWMDVDAQSLLAPDALDALAARLPLDRATPWGAGRGPADTVWMGVVDRAGNAVSFIQSIYHEFGSGLVLPGSGLNWQNRGCSFSLDPAARNPLTPRRKPFHTLNPALAKLADGRTLVYGTMGGDGQPQTQAAVFTRIVEAGLDPQAAIAAPRWLLGRTWGQASDSLKLESRFDAPVVEALRARGHDVEVLGAWDETMGHAGAIVRTPDGMLEGGYDPRSDGAVAAW